MLNYDGLKTARDSCCTFDTLDILAIPIIYEPIGPPLAASTQNSTSSMLQLFSANSTICSTMKFLGHVTFSS